MGKKWKKTIVAVLCFAAIFCAILFRTADVLRAKTSGQFYSEFWENPGEYDIWFLGTSHVYNAVDPLELWNRYGIRSYCLAAPTSEMPQTYWTLMCALQYAKPEILVLDTYQVYIDGRKHQKDHKLGHTGLDAIPLSATKIEGIFDIFDSWGDRFEYLYEFSIYHNRWDELKETDFEVPEVHTKGSRLMDENDSEPEPDFQPLPKDEVSDMDTTGFLYLEKIIEECERQGITLVLADIPYRGNEKAQRTMNAISKMAEERGIAVTDMMHQKGFVDWSVDYADRSHANLFGRAKVTRYIGEYLSEHCSLTDYRGRKDVAEKWNADYEKYLQYKTERMRERKEITGYVQWLADDRYTCYLYGEKEPDGLLAQELAQLDNLTHISREEAEKRIGEKVSGEYVILVEDKEGNLVDAAVFEKGERQ